MKSQRVQRGFTYLELVIVIIIISTLLYFGIDRLLKLQVDAEKAQLQQIIGTLQSALALTIAEHVARGDIAGLKRYINTNPMTLLAEQPPGYIGHGEAAIDSLKAGQWYFHDASNSLIYKVINTEYFDSTHTHADIVELKIEPVYDDNNHNSRFDARDTLKGLKLSSVSRYQWLNQPHDTPRTQTIHTKQ